MDLEKQHADVLAWAKYTTEDQAKMIAILELRYPPSDSRYAEFWETFNAQCDEDGFLPTLEAYVEGLDWEKYDQQDD